MLHHLLFALLFSSALAQETSLTSDDEEAADPRFFFLFNTTNLSVSLNSVYAGLLAILGGLAILAGLAYLAFLLAGDGDTGYSGHSGYGDTGYTSYASGRAADPSASPYGSIFDKLSVLDWIAMMEEVYRKFDATNMECQKRLVCELHQNESTWGSTARKMNDAFSYLQYFELLNLPTEMRMLLDEYLEAANKGRTSQSTCEQLYNTCEFSMKSLITKYNGSNSL